MYIEVRKWFCYCSIRNILLLAVLLVHLKLPTNKIYSLNNAHPNIKLPTQYIISYSKRYHDTDGMDNTTLGCDITCTCTTIQHIAT